jgi:MFS family permease
MLACIGGGIGAFVGGWAMDQYGAKAMYRFAAYCVGVLFVLRVVGVALAKCCCSPEAEPINDDYDVLPSDLTA